MSRSSIQAFAGVALAFFSLFSNAVGQEASVTLTSPDAWTRGETLSIQIGTSVRVAGTAIFAGGIRSVTVGGQLAQLTPDRLFPSAADFSITLPMNAGTAQVTILVTPNNGAPFSRTYRVALQARAAAPPSSSGSVAPTSTAAAPPSPWQEMAPRRKWYIAGAALGLAISFIHTQSTAEVCLPTVAGQNCYNRTTKTSYTAPGLGLVFASGGAALIDYRKTATRLRNEQGAAPRGPRLEAPGVGVQDGRFTLSLVRIRF